MTITLTHEESEKHFHSALCNAYPEVRSAGCDIEWDENDYNEAKESLQKRTPAGEKICIEDVLVEILRIGKKLTWNDNDGDGEYTRSIELKDVHERVQLMPIDHLMDMINEQDDATTGYLLLQQVFFNEQIFG